MKFQPAVTVPCTTAKPPTPARSPRETPTEFPGLSAGAVAPRPPPVACRERHLKKLLTLYAFLPTLWIPNTGFPQQRTRPTGFGPVCWANSLSRPGRRGCIQVREFEEPVLGF